ncbi:MAG: EAL domain-containing protein [Hyphomonadaceae bacterium]|nr:EAL domain-containing protein [Hyphomonadaceae bacterium]
MFTLTTYIGVTIVLFGAVLLAVVAWTGWTSNTNAVERERTLVENALDQSIIRVLSEQKSVAWWDDAVINVAQGRVNTEWADVQLGMYLSETYGHVEVYVLDSEDRSVYAWVDGENAGPAAFARRERDFAPLLREVRTGSREYPRTRDQAFVASQAAYRDLLGARVARWGGHILSVDGKPAVVTAITIVPNLEFDLVQGTPYMLVSVVPIDQTFMSTIGRSLLMQDLTFTETPAHDSAHNVDVFRADDGSTVGYLSWTPRRPGRGLLTVILPLVGLGVFAVGLLAQTMLRRLKRASAELEAREALAQHEAKHDQLSGLPNRRHFVEVLQDSLDSLLQRRHGERVAVAYIDVDRFKDINDTLGHQAGDALIVAVAERLQSVLGPGDFIARFGGDEFAVMRRAKGEADGAELADSLHSAFEQSFDVQGQNVRMTASIGLCMAPDHGMSPAELMRNADIALYQGKNQGRDRAMMFCAEMAAELEERREVELELERAIEAGGLEVHYQPVISCKNGQVTGVEALLRWNHPVKGAVSPAVFVPIAEETGLMPALGALVLERAFEDSKRWPGVQVAINLSPVQFRHVELIELLQYLVVKCGVEPSRFVLEVTEGVLLEASDRNRETIDALRELGFRVALDDFGTGYSSLSYLSEFRFDKIKIDRGFVTGIQERKRALTIIQSVVTLGRGLGMDIVAEGVETEAEATVMRLVGVTELQGYFFSPARPAEEMQGFIDALAANSEVVGRVSAPSIKRIDARS